MKKIYIILAILALLLVGFFLFKGDKIVEVNGNGYLNATYKIDGQDVRLTNGKSEKESTPGSASKIITQYFGNEVKSDLDDDGREDIAFILTQQTGGSGTFYYFVAALNKEEGFKGSDAVLLGDRIAPQSTNMGKGNIIVVNYADRKSGESFAVSPSEGKSMWLLLDPKTMQFGEVAQNFEGEADPSVMNLNMQTWTWINTVYGDDKEIKPTGTKPFTLTMKKDKSFSATTDCNGVGGEYVLKDDNKISFTKMMSTLMYCENSQEAEFTKMLGEVESYYFTNKGELVFNLKFDSGSMIFR
jgi:heat shock protein HslJ